MQLHEDRQVDPDDGDEEVAWTVVVDPRQRPETYCMMYTFHEGGRKGMYYVVLCTYEVTRVTKVGTRYVACEYHSKEYAPWGKKQWALEGEIKYDSSTVRSFSE